MDELSPETQTVFDTACALIAESNNGHIQSDDLAAATGLPRETVEASLQFLGDKYLDIRPHPSEPTDVSLDVISGEA